MIGLCTWKTTLLSLLVVGCGRFGYDTVESRAGDDAGSGDGPVSLCTAELEANAPYAAGSGTVEDPFQICSTTQLGALTGQPEDFGAAFVLMKDLDFEGIAYAGIGASATPFTGVIDGNGFTISNMVVAGVAAEPVGFVNSADRARLRNIILSDARITGVGSDGVAPLIGNCNLSQARNTRVERASVTGDSSVGGLVGYANECQVLGAEISATIVGSDSAVGGVIGNSNRNAIVDVRASVEVKAALAGEVGGVIGVDGWSPTIIQRVFIEGTIEGDTDVGGLVGFNGEGVDMYRSNFTGTIRGNTGVGGFVGGAYDSPFHVYSTSVNADIYGNNGVGGFSGWHYYRTRFFDCSFQGTLNGTGPNQVSIGGFFGEAYYYGWVERSYVDVTINSEATTVGGFIGQISYWSSNTDAYDIKDSFSVANVSGSAAADTVSLFVGENTDGNPLAALGSSYWSGGSCTNSGAGGCVGGGSPVSDIAQFQGSGAALPGWDFEGVWQAQAGAFPTLRNEDRSAPVVTQACPDVAIQGLRYGCDVSIQDADLNETHILLFDPSHSCSWMYTTTSSLYGTPTAENTSSCVNAFTVSDGAHDSAGQTHSIEVHAGVLMTPASSYGTDYFFGFGDPGVPIVQTFTLTNNEAVPVAALSLTPPAAGSEFAFDGGSYPGSGGTCADTLGPGQTCTVVFRYTPATTGSVTGPIAINFTAARGPVSYGFTLRGQGR